MQDKAELPNSCEQLLCAMIGFDTVNGLVSGRVEAERPLAEYLMSVARQWGFAVQDLPVEGQAPNLLITHEVKAGAPWLVFDSHMDTVDVAGMTVDPFQAKSTAGANGKIYGRGACDTKGTGAAMLWALRQYAGERNGAANIAVLFSVDEECGMTGADAFARIHLRQLDWDPVGVVVGEPTMMKLVTGSNGVVRWKIRTTGVATHSSSPARGRSAISDMIRVVDALESRYIPSLQAQHPMTGQACCSINIIHGGVQVNIIPESCSIDIDRRLVPGEDGRSVLPAVEKILDDVRMQHPQLQVKQDQPRIVEPHDPAVGKLFAEKVGAVLAPAGFDPQPTGAPYGTNGNRYGPQGIPTVILGPGSIDQAHTKDEWLSVKQLHLGVQGYYQLMSAPAKSWT